MDKNELNEKLLDACYDGDFKFIKYLLTSPYLKEHADVNYEDCNYGWNPLMNACCNGNLKIVKYLLTSKKLKEHADINCEDNDGWNPLFISCYNDNFDVAEYLILEQNIQVDEDTINLLNEYECHNIIKIIETRDLKNKLNSKLAVKEAVKRSKI